MKKVAIVQFNNDYHKKGYNFLCSIEGLQQGDTLVVDTVNGLGIAKFEKYDELGFGHTGAAKPTKWVICKVPLEEHNKRIQAAEKANLLKKMMEEQRKKTEEIAIYEILAKENPEMQKMLDEYKELAAIL